MSSTSKIVLENKILKASEAYYSGKEVVMTDDQFDHLLKQLEENFPKSSLLKVGFGFKPENRKTKHLVEFEIGSLDKIKFPESFSSYNYATPKLDGLSIVNYFYNGNLVLSLTRANGIEGVIVTSKMLKIIHVNDLLCIRGAKSKGWYVDRGEVIIPNSKLGELEKLGITNQRNYASGIMNRIEDTELDLLTFIPYSILVDDSQEYLTKVNVLNELAFLHGHSVIPIEFLYPSMSPDYLLTLYKYYQETYPVDGVVLTNADLIDGQDDSIAYKFPSETAEVIVSNIVWSTGSSGRVTPVVEFSPVFLSGATISRASGFNFQFIKDNLIGIGSLIEITRANEVIPHINSSLSPGKCDFPLVCSECQSPLRQKGVDLVCKNELCRAKFFASAGKYFEVCGVPHGLGWTTIEKFLDLFHITSLIELLKIDQIIDRPGAWDIISKEKFFKEEFGEHYGILLLELLKNFKTSLTPEEFWFIFNFENLGETNSKKINIVPSNNTPAFDFRKELESLENTVPYNAVNAIIENFVYVKEILNLVSIDFSLPVEVSKDSYKICLTGKLEFGTRSQFLKYLKDFGVAESSVQSCDYLVTNKQSSSSKYKYAEEHNIPIISEVDFIKVIKGESK